MPPFSQSHAHSSRAPTPIGWLFARACESLGPRRQRIVLGRTHSWSPATLVELGAEFGISRERVRQIEQRLRHDLELELAGAVGEAARWLRGVVGEAAPPASFDRALGALIGDARPPWRAPAEVAVMRAAGYRRLDGVVGGRRFRRRVELVRRLAPEMANPAGVIDEEALRDAAGARAAPEWESMARNAGLARVAGRLALRDIRRARVFLALEREGEPCRRDRIAAAAGLDDSSSLSSLFSADPLFVRFTKDKWGLAQWTGEPYGGVVGALVSRIEEGGGRARLDDLLKDIPRRFEVRPGTVRHYLGTPKFAVEGGYVSVVPRPVAPPQPLAEARDVVWTADGAPMLRIVVGKHHLKGNSHKISGAVAQHLGVGLDQARKIPFGYPAGVGDASVIWRSYDPSGPELGRIREAMEACGARPGTEVMVMLDPELLHMRARSSADP